MARKDVEIRVSGKLDPSLEQATNRAKSAIDRFAAAQAKTQNRRNLYSNQIKEAGELYNEMNRLGGATEALAVKLNNAKRPSKALRDEFEATKTAARAAKTEFAAAGQALATMQGKAGGGRGSFAIMDASAPVTLRAYASAANQAENSTENLTRDLPPLAAAHDRATKAINAHAAAERNLNAAQKGGKRGLAEGIVGSAATRNQRGPLGLRPYELQNLSYQVNDFFTQIASGTSVTQVFAQQFGQVAQLFPAVLSGALRLIPVIGGLALVFAPFVSSLNEFNREAAAMKNSQTTLAGLGNAADYSAPKLAAATRAIERMGISSENAQTLVTSFVRKGLDPAYIERFAQSSKTLAKVLDIDVVDAAERVETAFTGNAQGALDLANELGTLSREEQKHARELIKDGKEAEARTFIYAAFERKMNDINKETKGPWSTTLKNFGNAWRSFVDYVNFIDWSNVKKEVGGLIRMIERLTGMLPGARQQATTFSGVVQEQIAARQNLTDVESFQFGSAFSPVARIAGIVARGRARNRLSRADRAVAEYNASVTAPPVVTPTDTTIDTSDDRIAPKADRTRSGKTDAERQAEAQQKYLEGLAAENEAREFQLTLIDQSERESKILAEIEQQRVAALGVGLELTQDQQEAIRTTVGDLYDAQKAKEADLMISRAQLELAERRGEVETESAFVTRRLQEEGLDSVVERVNAEGDIEVVMTAQARQYADILRAMYRINEVTRQRTAAEKVANDQLALREQLMESITFAQEQGDAAGAATLLLQLQGVNVELTKAIDGMIAFWSTQTGPEAQAALLHWQQVRASIALSGQQAIVTGQQINDSIATKGVSAFDQFADAVGNGINVFTAAKDAFLQFASDFLREIAQMIAKQAILNALGGGFGSPNGGGGASIAGWINSLFKHSGGVVGHSGGGRSVPASVFAGGVYRYHSGGIAGLAPNEVPAILKRGEEVLTENDPRHRNNGAGGSGGSLTVANVFDPAEMLNKALASDRGGKVFFNYVSENADAFKVAIG